MSSDRRRRRARDRLAVERRAPAAGGGEHLVERPARTPLRRRAPCSSTTADRGAPHRQVVDEVDGSVDRVDVPLEAARVPAWSAPSSPTIASSGRTTPQLADDQRFGGPVELGHRIGRRSTSCRGRPAGRRRAGGGRRARGAGVAGELLGEPAELAGARRQPCAGRRRQALIGARVRRWFGPRSRATRRSPASRARRRPPCRSRRSGAPTSRPMPSGRRSRPRTAGRSASSRSGRRRARSSRIAAKAATRTPTDGKADSARSSLGSAGPCARMVSARLGAVTSTPADCEPTGARQVRSRTGTILHADMDAFFVSVELRRRPELVGQPVVVGGTGRPRRRGRSVVRGPAVRRALGDAVGVARRRCPHAVFLPGDHELYARSSRDVREIFDRFTPIVEPLSLDEAFLDVTGAVDAVRRRRGDRRTRSATAVRDELTLGCSVGVAPNKFLAKLASVEAKPVAHPDRIEPGPGVVVVEPGGSRSSSTGSPVERMWGVGPVTLDKLHRLGVTHGSRDLRERRRRRCSPRRSARPRPAISRRWRAGTTTGRSSPTAWPKSIGHEETFAVDKFTRRRTATGTRAPRRWCRARGCGEPRSAPARSRSRCASPDSTPSPGRSTTTDARRPGPRHPRRRSRRCCATIDPTPGVRLLGLSGSNLGPPIRQLTLRRPRRRRPTGAPAAGRRLGVGDRGAGRDPGALRRVLDRPGERARRGRIRVVRPGEQQWGPDQDAVTAPSATRNHG